MSTRHPHTRRGDPAAARGTEAVRSRGRRWRRRLSLLGLALAFSACGPEPEEPTPPRLVVLYAPCTLNKWFLQPYDPSVDYTPRLAAFGHESLGFQRHQTESGQSGVAFASLFSGTQADHHGVYENPGRIDSGVRLITRAYAEAGWDVHTWLAHPLASADLGYAQGVPSDHVHAGVLTGESATVRAILDRLAADPSYRALLITNFTITHGPYKTWHLTEFCEDHPIRCRDLGDEEDFRRVYELYEEHHRRWSFDYARTARFLDVSAEDLRRMRTVARILYQSNVFQLDRLFGALVKEIDDRGLRDESLVAFTSDHGEVLVRDTSHFRWTHGYQLAPEVISVAFLLRGPGVGVRPGRYPAVTRSIDVFPTLAGLSGVMPPSCEGCGVDLSRVVRGIEEPPSIVAFSHTAILGRAQWEQYGRYPLFAALFPRREPGLMWVAARDGDEFFKRRRTLDGRWETVMFDLAVDRRETENRLDRADPRHARMEGRLTAYGKTLASHHRARSGDLEETDEARRLRSLGYIE